jgi:hypothetical protein
MGEHFFKSDNGTRGALLDGRFSSVCGGANATSPLSNGLISPPKAPGLF